MFLKRIEEQHYMFGHYIYRYSIGDVAANNGANNAHSKVGEKREVTNEVPIKTDMTYGVEDTPPWYLCIFLAFQHYMIMAGSMMGIPFILSSLFCIGEDDPAKGQLISTFLFSSGIITFLQTTFGVRLPIVQGSTFAFLIPTIAIITTSYPTCETYDFGNLTKFERDELWMVRMREIQGAVGFLLNWISPLTIVPTITLVGLSLFKAAADKAAGQWGVQPPPKHAINRGIATEGIGCIIAAMLGTGNGTTSFSENIGALRVTRVASRRVIQVASIFMIVCGVFAKFGAFLGTLPDPVVGGIFMVMFGIIAAVGLSNLQSVDLNSSRNLFVLGISLFFGLSVPEWVEKNSDLIQTGSVIADQLIIVLLRTQISIRFWVNIIFFY
ncbi:putative nucleobase-ascorbate transporter 9 [Armadillidium nasatum]|uniref:Putative nucleobase-ascorbate transporter 9 n=1 Tax=Armadillidium nasatum TaxID=96803 RepID=A0A5N5TDY8_9CRUS|nr:putative nucleobase-ascorbate transporter 9 [Armadillidium nasatum]